MGMTKQEILDYFGLIDFAYNESGRLESLSRMLDELLKEQETKPLRCKECSYHRNDGWCDEHIREVKESDYCSFGAWEGR